MLFTQQQFFVQKPVSCIVFAKFKTQELGKKNTNDKFLLGLLKRNSKKLEGIIRNTYIKLTIT